MAKLQKGTFRNSTGWLRQRLSKRNMLGLDASGSIDDELWTFLEYKSEISDVGIKFIEQNGIGKRKSKIVYKHFQAYIRQAKNYYYSAKKLHPRSSALLYYYCFLNLAKAEIVIKNPEIGGVKIGHGVSALPKNFENLKSQTVKILNNKDIFPRLYELHFGVRVKPQSLNIDKLFSYCTDISYQNMMANSANCKLLRCYCVNITDKKNQTGWPLIGIESFEQCKPFVKSFSKFYENFEQVVLPPFMGREFFDEDNFQLSNFTFFQSKQTFKWITDNIPPAFESSGLVFSSFGSLIQTNYYKSNFDYYVSLPYLPRNQMLMDETIAIYLIMFYLSNLVRYNPKYLEELLNKKESWLIDSFIRSCPLAYLKSMVSRITNTDYIIGAR